MCYHWGQVQAIPIRYQIAFALAYVYGMQVFYLLLRYLGWSDEDFGFWSRGEERMGGGVHTIHRHKGPPRTHRAGEEDLFLFVYIHAIYAIVLSTLRSSCVQALWSGTSYHIISCHIDYYIHRRRLRSGTCISSWDFWGLVYEFR